MHVSTRTGPTKVVVFAIATCVFAFTQARASTFTITAPESTCSNWQVTCAESIPTPAPTPTPTPTPARPTTFTITAPEGTCSNWQVTCAGSIPTPAPTPTRTAPPVATCSGAVYLGDIKFDGVLHVSDGMVGTKIAYARVLIPNPLPANYVGKQTSISVFEYVDASYWKKVTFTKAPCDFTQVPGAWGQGTGANIYLGFGAQAVPSVTVQPGEVWYLNVKNESMTGKPSCGAGLSCNFAVRAYPPSN